MVYPASNHVKKVFKCLQQILPTGERDKPQILLLTGELTPFRNDTDRELSFRQESNFYYLSGCTVPASLLLASLASDSGEVKTQLFIPRPTLDDLTWSVAPPTLDEAQASFDVTSVAHPPELDDALTSLLSQLPNALVHTLPKGSPLFPALPEQHVQLVLGFNTGGQDSSAVTDAYLLRALHLARLVKDEQEIALIRKANAISSRAHEVVMRVLGNAVKNKLSSHSQKGKLLLPGDWLIEKEGEGEAIFVASCRREGSVHQAYLPIVAASNRASTLHYCCNDRDFAWGPVKATDHLNASTFAYSHAEGNGHAHTEEVERDLAPQVLLIDAGCEWDCYASDITRTMPIGNGGKFTKESGDIYDLVLEMQNRSFSIIKAGVHWDAVHLLCHRILVKGFLKYGIFKASPNARSGEWSTKDEDAILASGISWFFFPHGLGHSLGMDVHDVPSTSKPDNNPTIAAWRSTLPSLTANLGEGWGHESFYRFLRLRLPLEANMVVTVEPGVYFSPHLIAAGLASDSPGARFVDLETLERYRTVGGIRIEDVAVIKPDGYENLTTVKSERQWIEAVCSGEI